MTWKDFARIATNLYNELRKRGFYENDIWTLINLYFTSGAYRDVPEPKPVEEEDDA